MNERILIVDDKSSHRRFIKDVLRSEGYEIFEAEKSTQAMELLRLHPSMHVLILDQMLPGQTGLEFWKQLKETDEFGHFKNLKVIFITAYPEDIALNKFRQDGGIVLAKPLSDYQEIIDAVHELLNIQPS